MTQARGIHGRNSHSTKLPLHGQCEDNQKAPGEPRNDPVFSVFQANIVVCTGCTCCSLSLPRGIAEVCDNSCDPRIGNLDELEPTAYVDAVPTEGGCHFVSAKSTPDCNVSQGQCIANNVGS